MREIPFYAVLAAILFIACDREKTETIFRTAETDFRSITTRSLLTEADIENKKSVSAVRKIVSVFSRSQAIKRMAARTA